MSIARNRGPPKQTRNDKVRATASRQQSRNEIGESGEEFLKVVKLSRVINNRSRATFSSLKIFRDFTGSNGGDGFLSPSFLRRTNSSNELCAPGRLPRKIARS